MHRVPVDPAVRLRMPRRRAEAGRADGRSGQHRLIEPEQHHRAVVAASLGPIPSPADQRFEHGARRVGLDRAGDLLVREVAPGAVGTQQEGVTDPRLPDARDSGAGHPAAAERLGEAPRRRMQPCPLGAQPPLPAQLLAVGVVEAAVHDLPVANVIDAAVADMAPVDPMRLHQHRSERRMGLEGRRDPGELEHHVHFGDQVLEEAVGRIVRAVRVEQPLGGAHHLFGRQRATGPSAHAVGEQAEHAAWRAASAQDRDTVLLLGAVAAILCGTGRDREDVRTLLDGGHGAAYDSTPALGRERPLIGTNRDRHACKIRRH